MANNKTSKEAIHIAIDAVLEKNARSAVVYVSPSLVAKATCQRKIGLRDRNRTVLVTFGAPNFLERQHIRACRKMGMAFPLNEIGYKFWKNKKF